MLGTHSSRDQQVEAATKDLMEANLRLVVTIALRYGNGPVHVLDLVQEGNWALLHAARTFLDSRQGDFTAYAKDQIDRAIRELIGDPPPARYP
jgi:RNA polymerase primary sigma factor